MATWKNGSAVVAEGQRKLGHINPLADQDGDVNEEDGEHHSAKSRPRLWVGENEQEQKQGERPKGDARGSNQSRSRRAKVNGFFGNSGQQEIEHPQAADRKE